MTAFLLVWLVALVTLALDAGRLYLEQRRLQQAADLAAVSAAASCQALFQGDACGHASLRLWAIDAVQENGIDVDAGDATLTLTQGAVDDGGRFLTESGLANSVEVRLQREVPSSLLANLGELIGGEVDDNTRLTATGVARRASMVTLSAGTSLLEVDTSESAVLALLLDRLIGARLDL
ncbi:MAG: pilus assembly protein TadG-related protein, partial [Pseudomonadota bacterium]|nr:pilus assembly protein TadG-related protein [Pseudomonadota bacterium]